MATTGIWKIEKRLDHVIDYTTNIEKTLNRKIKSLSKEVLNELIDVIYVRKDGTLDIKFKYQDEYESLVNYLKEGAKENEKVDIRNISQAFI